MCARDLSAPAVQVGKECSVVVIICDDAARAEDVGRRVLNLNRCMLVTYQRPESMRCSMPAGPVAAVIVDLRAPAPVIGRTVQWLRHRWPRCPVTVVGDVGGGEFEMVARKGGASYLTRPVTDKHWSGLLSHVLADPPNTIGQHGLEGRAGAVRASGTVAH